MFALKAWLVAVFAISLERNEKRSCVGPMAEQRNREKCPGRWTCTTSHLKRAGAPALLFTPCSLTQRCASSHLSAPPEPSTGSPEMAHRVLGLLSLPSNLEGRSGPFTECSGPERSLTSNQGWGREAGGGEVGELGEAWGGEDV